MRFRTKPFLIEAEKLTEENGEALAKWCGGSFHPTHKPGYSSSLRVPTIHGVKHAQLGWWVVKGNDLLGSPEAAGKRHDKPDALARGRHDGGTRFERANSAENRRLVSQVSQYLVKGPEGDFYPCTPEYFESRHDGPVANSA